MTKTVISGNTFLGGGTGIKTDSIADIDLRENSFQSVATPFDIAPGSTGSVVDNVVRKYLESD